MGLFEKFIGSWLMLAGLCLWAYLIFFIYENSISWEISDNVVLNVIIILFCTGGAFVWIGYRWLFPKQRNDNQLPPNQKNRYLPILLRLCRAVKYVGALGMALAAAHAACLLFAESFISRSGLLVLMWSPLLVWRFTSQVLHPIAHEKGLIPEETLNRWSASTRMILTVLLRIVWPSYAAFLVFDSAPFRLLFSWVQYPPIQSVGWSIISLIYASQVFVLHFGWMRELEGVSTRIQN